VEKGLGGAHVKNNEEPAKNYSDLNLIPSKLHAALFLRIPKQTSYFNEKMKPRQSQRSRIGAFNQSSLRK
jgi:hypothetical protein